MSTKEAKEETEPLAERAKGLHCGMCPSAVACTGTGDDLSVFCMTSLEVDDIAWVPVAIAVFCGGPEEFKKAKKGLPTSDSE